MAQSVVLYFSQNGHTKALAERIAARLEEGSISCDTVDIVNSAIPDMKEYKMIFVGSPLYYGVEPLIWEKYIDKLPNLSGKAGFIFSTYGVEGNAAPDSLMVENLKYYFSKKNLKILSSHGTVCEDTWPPLKKIGVSKDRPNEEDYKLFDGYIDRIISEYKQGKVDRAVYDYSVNLKVNTLGNTIKKMFVKTMPKVTVDTQKCTRCGFCAGGCPAGNIEVSNSAVIKSNCIKCYNCEKVCLNKAIKVNWKLLDYTCEKFLKSQENQ